MDKTTDRLLELLSPFFKDKFKMMNGDPIYLPTSMLPAIVIVKTGGVVEDGPTGADFVTEDISIRVVYNMNDYLGASMTENIPHNEIVDMLEARKDTGEYEDKSIIGLIRKNYTLGNSVVGQKFSVKYDLLAENRSEDGVITLEGHLDFTTRQLVAVANRI